MNTGQLNFALKLIQEEYRLEDHQILKISRRLLADEREFERVWQQFKNKSSGESDSFVEVLKELLS